MAVPNIEKAMVRLQKNPATRRRGKGCAELSYRLSTSTQRRGDVLSRISRRVRDAGSVFDL